MFGSTLRRFMAALGVAMALTAGAHAADKRHVIVMTHAFDTAREARLTELVDHFNGTDKRYRIELQRAGEAQASAPTLMVLEGAAEDAVRQRRDFKPMYSVMAQSGVHLGRARGRAGIGMTVDRAGRRLALPIGMHTPVLYYNEQAFRAVGLDPNAPPRTWHSLQDALGKLFDAGYACPYTVARPSWVMLDNVSARQNEAVTRRKGRAEELSVNGMLQIRHVALMASWVRARYLHVFHSHTEAEQRFARGECAIIAGSSADWPSFRQDAAFQIGVGELPYYDDQPGGIGGTLADGPSLWAAAGKSRNDYRAAASFVRFMLRPENQLAWQRGTGYLPLDTKGMVAGEAVANDEPSLLVARKQLHLDDAKGAKASVSLAELPRRAEVRSMLDEELAAVWADTKPAKQALDTAVVRAGAVR
ncbi:extracellular solute-binding protein [Nitrogeniibacter mangrovi]|uniref:sn-glycerol-3-phosphate-binding periplasmic protein UgpB n=1 Tax=Nitrogeniibacter mangrovi TaxID=2016596 RepID=A0A6C1B7A5_9RHOO|nr:extracellular solute-binding protein [Nitrogeniibacter mangrovi]QID18705.1 extracellular solute-binding protein [Nitrogeniibacter mangrovi]